MPMHPPPPIPADEAERMAQLRRLVVLDSAPEAVFDSIARMASQVCGAPMAMVSLVDDERQWFKASVGLDGVSETPRDLAFCAYTVCSDDVLEVPDATRDPRFAHNPLVTGGPLIRFYAGTPLVVGDDDGGPGARVGSLCVVDREARALTPEQTATLQSLARIAAKTLTMRRDLIERTLAVSQDHQRTLHTQQAFLQRIGRVAGIGGWQLELDSGQLIWSDETFAIHELDRDHVPTVEGGIAFYAPQARPVIAEAVRQGMLLGKGWDLELPFVTAKGSELWVRAVGEAEFADGKPVRLVGAFQDVTERRASEQRLRDLTAITEHSPDWVMQTGADGVVRYANPAARAAFGIADDAVLSERHYTEFNTAATNAVFRDTVAPALLRDGVWLGDTTVRLKGGHETPVSHLVLAHRDAAGTIQSYSAVVRDISAQVHVKRQLQQQAGTLRSMAEAVPAMISVIGADTRMRFVNSAFERWFGEPRDRLLGRTMQEVLGRSQYAVSRPHIDRALAGEVVQFEKEYPGRDTWSHVSISYTPLWLDGGAVDGFVAVAQDISQHRQEQGRLRKLSERDPLTGLLNRAGFEAYLQGAVADDGGAGLALLYIDLDRFKPVNDQHGHAMGDRLLHAFGQRLQNLVRPTDAVARLGGDEFAVALPHVRNGGNARRIADKVLTAAHTAFDLAGVQLHIGASVGVAFGADADGGWRALLARADAMLYSAKADGRGRQAGAVGEADHAHAANDAGNTHDASEPGAPNRCARGDVASIDTRSDSDINRTEATAMSRR